MVAKQMSRSGASIGANLCEANHAFSGMDFAHKCNIALKEAAESHYWLRLAAATSLLAGPRLDAAIAEAHQLQRILAAIVKKVQTIDEPSP
jgi:four helix bundle protein